MLTNFDINSLSFNPFKVIGKQWMLITAGDQEKCNTMTASWGSLGVLWNKNISTIYVRPQRYTVEFLDKCDYYSLCLFGDAQRPALNYCGSHSGRDVDKIKETGLTVLYDEKAPYFAEATDVLICRKLYCQKIDPNCFIDQSIHEANYPNPDYHKVYTGEIVKVLTKVK